MALFPPDRDRQEKPQIPGLKLTSQGDASLTPGDGTTPWRSCHTCLTQLSVTVPASLCLRNGSTEISDTGLKKTLGQRERTGGAATATLSFRISVFTRPSWPHQREVPELGGGFAIGIKPLT